MFDKMMDLVKGQVSKTIGGMSEIPENRRSAVVETTATSLMDGLKKYATPDHLSSLLGIGGGGAGGGAASGISSGVVAALTSKVGLNSGAAQKIASSTVPAVMSLFKKKVQDTGDPGFNIQSIIGGLTGGGTGTSGAGVMGMLGQIFGKK